MRHCFKQHFVLWQLRATKYFEELGETSIGTDNELAEANLKEVYAASKAMLSDW